MAEAFSRGTPVVASQLGAAGELVDSLKTGLHFTPGDADDLAEKVKWMVSRPVERAQMGREARLVFENRYSSSQNHAQLVEIYLRAIEQA
jgi:glycosyltransferase involved in cell wall biosynthesis